jgi:hypothetical protein
MLNRNANTAVGMSATVTPVHGQIAVRPFIISQKIEISSS